MERVHNFYSYYLNIDDERPKVITRALDGLTI